MSSSPRKPVTPQDMARRWKELAERQRRHLIELYRSGRWRHYYTEEQLTAQMRDAVRSIERWSAAGGKSTASDRDGASFRDRAQ